MTMTDDPARLNAEGMAMLGQRDFARAADLFARAAAADPQAPPLWINLATARRGAGDDAGERAALRQVIELDQRHLVANLRLAELHERRGEDAEAIQRWTAVAQLTRAIPERVPAIDDLMRRADAYVAAKSAAFGALLDAGLATARDGLDGGELRRFDACVDTMLGRRRIYVNECHGLHFPFLPADEFFAPEHFPWMRTLEAQTGAIRAELDLLLANPDGLVPYVAMDKGTPENKWSALDQSLDWSAFFLWRHGVRDDAACARCPATAAALEAVPLSDMPGRAPTAFFSILKPGTHLPAHTGVSNVRAIVHLPLVVPERCGFRVGGTTRDWRVGEAFAFDDTIEHEAWNHSDQPRAVLIFDVWNPHLTAAERALLRTLTAVSDASGLNPAVGE
jgi:aspartyl/asparaginyl beta-hydroxylase (cupin superfamily)